METDRRIPLWKHALDAVDGLVAPRLESALQSQNYSLAVALTSRARSGVTSRTQRLSRKLLHTANLPAATDLNRLLAQIGSVERQVRELRKLVADDRLGEEVKLLVPGHTFGDSGTDQP